MMLSAKKHGFNPGPVLNVLYVAEGQSFLSEFSNLPGYIFDTVSCIWVVSFEYNLKFVLSYIQIGKNLGHEFWGKARIDVVVNINFIK